MSSQGSANSINIAGPRGMVGAALVHALAGPDHTHLITRTHAELDLTDQAAVETVFADQRPSQVYRVSVPR